MARVTGGSFPAQAWHDFMVMAHDTDNIPQIPGIALHPVQVAEQERIAAAQRAAEDATAGSVPTAAPTPESVKDMSQGTRQVLEKIGGLLKEARPLDPSQTRRPDRAEAPAAPGGKPQPSLASATSDGGARPAAPANSSGPGGGAPVQP